MSKTYTAAAIEYTIGFLWDYRTNHPNETDIDFQMRAALLRNLDLLHYSIPSED